MGAVLDSPPNGVGVGLAECEDLGREGARRRALARPGRPVEEIGMRERARGEPPSEDHPRVRVILRTGELHGAHTGALIDWTSSITSACTSCGGRAASTR